MRAVADALRTEYRAIVDRGLLLQIDAPDLALERHTLFADRPLDEFLEWVELVVDVDQRRARRHRPGRASGCTCAGATTKGPHTHDVAFADIQPLLYAARVGALVDVDGQRPPRPRVPLLRAPIRCPTAWRSSPA